MHACKSQHEADRKSCHNSQQTIRPPAEAWAQTELAHDANQRDLSRPRRAARRGGYARTASVFLDGLDLTEADAVAPPPRRDVRPRPDRVLVALRTWRDVTARRNNVLPVQLMSDRDLASIASERPTTAEDLQRASSLGPIAARRLAPELADVIETAIGEPSQSPSSTMTGA